MSFNLKTILSFCYSHITKGMSWELRAIFSSYWLSMDLNLFEECLWCWRCWRALARAPAPDVPTFRAKFSCQYSEYSGHRWNRTVFSSRFSSRWLKTDTSLRAVGQPSAVALQKVQQHQLVQQASTSCGAQT